MTKSPLYVIALVLGLLGLALLAGGAEQSGGGFLILGILTAVAGYLVVQRKKNAVR